MQDVTEGVRGVAVDANAVRSVSPVGIFKITASLIFALGVAIHAGRIVMGPEPFVRQVFTPGVDTGFAVLILVGAISGLLSWPRYSGGRLGRFGYGFAMVILVVSVPLHFRSLLTWSTDYMLIFPFWYSAVEVPMFLGLSYMVTRLRFND